MVETPAPGSPEAWIARLMPVLRKQRLHAKLYDSYYSGERELDIVRRDFSEVFAGAYGTAADGSDTPGPEIANAFLGRFWPHLPAPRTNISRVGVDALAERLRLIGFRVGDTDDEAGSRAADEIMRRNDFDVMAPISFVEAFVKGASFLLVWPDADGRPVITVEDCTQVAVVRSALPPYDVVAAIKVYPDEWTGREVTALYLPDGVRTFRKRLENRRTRIVMDETMQVPPPIWRGQVPVFEIANRQRLLRPPSSELVDVAPLADNHAKLLADMMIAASFGAIPIRTATGIKLRFENGEVVSPFDIRADRILASENPNARYGQLEGSSLAGYVAGLDRLLIEVRIVTRVPQHYYGSGTAAGQSGETLRAAEASMMHKLGGVVPRVGSGYRGAMTLALLLDAEGRFDTRPAVTPRFASVETRVRASEVDAANKLHEMGLPLQILLQDLGYEQATITKALELIEEQRVRDDALLTGSTVPVERPRLILPPGVDPAA